MKEEERSKDYTIKFDESLHQYPERVIYFFGVPKEGTWEDVKESMKDLGIEEVEVKHHQHTDEFGDQCDFWEAEFDSDREADKILDSDFKVMGKPIITLPQPYKKKLRYLIPYHQVLITFKDKSQWTSTLEAEIDSLYTLFSNHGDLVDLNLNWFPDFIVPTF